MAKLKNVAAPAVMEDEDEPDCPACPPVGAPAWMATFADMATLLMSFFVLILAFANFDEVSMEKMTGVLREQFGVRVIDIMPNPEESTILDQDSPPSGGQSSPEQADADQQSQAGAPSEAKDQGLKMLAQALQTALDDGQMTVMDDDEQVVVRLPEGANAEDVAKALADAAQDLAEPSRPEEKIPDAAGDGSTDGSAQQRRAAIAESRMNVALAELKDRGLVDVQQKRDKVVVTVGAGGAFSSGSATLTDEAKEIMSRVALASVGEDVQITVTGHTDSVPLSGGQFEDNWGLAAARASSVVRELADSGLVPAKNLSAISKGDGEPVADNGTEEGRSANRRIEITLDFATVEATP